MARDLELANRVWFAAKKWAAEEAGHGVDRVDYAAALMVVCALLSDVELAQELVNETWDKETVTPND